MKMKFSTQVNICWKLSYDNFMRNDKKDGTAKASVGFVVVGALEF